MTVKLAILKSGEDIIADIHEMVIEDKVVGYILNKPCNIKMQFDDDKKTKTDSVRIRLTPWILLSKDEKIRVPLEWVITMVDPIDKLYEMYKEDILKNGKNGKNSQNFSASEQSDLSQSN